MLDEIARHFRAGDSFAFETTLAGRGYARRIPVWQAAGYKVKFIFLKLKSPDQAMARVAERVHQGGHIIAEDVIRRRFRAGWSNFRELYGPLVDAWVLYDNSGRGPVLLDWRAANE